MSRGESGVVSFLKKGLKRLIGFSTSFKNALKNILSDSSTAPYFLFLMIILSVALFGPALQPHEYDERQRGEDGEILRSEPPSLENPLGTTEDGYDVLSRVLFGTRPTLLAGVLSGTMIISIALTVGVTAGYAGGKVDDLLMRFTDVVYGVPLIPFALVLVAFLGIGYYQSILVVGLILWRGSARVLRSQVLQIKERPFILSARATGASRPHIIIRHILPNIAPMAVLFLALGIGQTIIIFAGLAFLGVTDPFVPSWGVMVRNAFDAGMVASAWWWSLPPGFLISLTVLSLFMFGRGYESQVSGDGDEALAEAN